MDNGGGEVIILNHNNSSSMDQSRECQDTIEEPINTAVIRGNFDLLVVVLLEEHWT